MTSRRTQLIVWAVVASIALIAVAVIATAGSGGGLRLLGQGAGSDDSATRQILGERDGADLPPAQQGSVAGFAATYGDPPYTDFARMRIPAIGVDAPVGRWIVDAAVMPEPYGPTDVAFYDLSAWAGIGGFPGGGANAVFGAHVDLNREVGYAGAHYRGPAVFWDLEALTPGDIVEIDYAGETLSYSVVWVEQVPDTAGANWYQYWTSDVPVDSVTLFTCGGEFNFDTAQYSHRTIVRAERI